MVDQNLITSEITGQFQNSGEHVMYNERIQKLKVFGGGGSSGRDDIQERLYIQTTDNIYTFKRSAKT